MKRILSILISVLFSVLSVSAQDLIAPRIGDIIEARIIEEGSDYVKYRLYDEQGGPIHKLYKSEILMIKYESTGHVEDFSEKMPSTENANETESPKRLPPYLKYRQLKTMYDHRYYVPDIMDKYTPGWIGVASFFIPGLGECICGEWGRGLGKLGANVVFATTGSVCVARSYYDSNWEADIIVAVICYAAVVGIDIWSIIDAVRISKVKNMYMQDLWKQYSLDIDLYPSINYAYIGNSVKPTAGLTLAVRF